MHTFRITLAASMAGWVAGILAGTIGGFVLALVQYGLKPALQVITTEGFILSEVQWTFAMAVAILPFSGLCVAPMVFRALGKNSFWHPLKAACIGGGIGLVGLVFWFMVVSLFTVAINWARDGLGVVVMFACTALAIGATVGCVAALVGRSSARSMPAAPASTARDIPPQLPFEY